MRRQIPSALQYQVASLFIEDVRESAPGGIRRNAPAKFGESIQPFENSAIRIRTEFVAVDARVGKSCEHFVVAGIGKCQAICDARNTSLLLVSEDLAVADDRAPQKGEQGGAALLRIVAPEFFR